MSGLDENVGMARRGALREVVFLLLDTGAAVEVLHADVDASRLGQRHVHHRLGILAHLLKHFVEEIVHGRKAHAQRHRINVGHSAGHQVFRVRSQKF